MITWRHTRCTKLPSGAAMYSKARIAGHPIHPMLIAFPIALYAATVVTLFAFIGTKDYFWYRAATYANIAAVVMAVVAAVPGLIDLLNVPDRSKARATGLRHGDSTRSPSSCLRSARSSSRTTGS